MLLDSFGRVHTHLRVSVTDRCNLRCVYCMPEDATFLDRSALLTFEEIAAFADVAIGQGIESIRLTGGEPLLRRDLHRLVGLLAAIPGLRDLSLTTNGLLLAQQARALRDAGLTRLNVSLDTLDEGRFEQLSRRSGLKLVLEGLDESSRVGFERIKINTVALRGFIEADAVPLARFCRERGYELRFIETMPIGADPWERHRCVMAHELLDWLEAAFGPIVPAAGYDPHAPAMAFEYADGGGTFGIIASISRPFCKQCNRLRLTAEGALRNCLFALDELDIKPFVRRDPIDRGGLIAALFANVEAKWEGHDINAASFVKPLRTMHAIGG